MTAIVILVLIAIVLRQRRTITRMRKQSLGLGQDGAQHRRGKARKQEAPVVKAQESETLWKGPQVDLYPTMPTPVALKDMPQERIAQRRAANREWHTEQTKIMQLEAQVREAEQHICEITDDQVEALLEAHYSEVFASPEKRAELRSFLDAADQAYQLRNSAGIPVMTNRERRAAEKLGA